MKISSLRKFLVTLIQQELKVPAVWSNQNHPKLKPPFVTLWLYGFKEKAQAETRLLNNTETLVTPNEAVLELQLYGREGTFPCDELENFVARLSTDSVLNECASAGVSFFDSEPVQDLTGLLDDRQTFECKAVVELHIRYMYTVEDDISSIDEVEIEGHYADVTQKFSVKRNKEA